jgi:RimJ/RimL family protein N-acetyltransferase
MAGAGEERRVSLRDGREATLRAIRPSDREAFLAFHAGLSDESRYLRYFSARRRLPEREIRHFTEVDQRDHAGVVTCLDGAVVGHALYDRLAEPEEAEVALEVADALQGHGIGTLMLEELARIAARAGIRRFVAHVLPTNQLMLQVFRDLGFAESAAFEDGVVRVELELGASARFAEARRARSGRRRKQPADPR